MVRGKILFLSLLFILAASLTHGDGKSSRVLLLNSYHKGYLWSDEITRGVEESFSGRNIDLYVEYMDTKRDYDSSYLDLLASLYKTKYEDLEFDLVITSDNNAFNFYRDRGREIFGNIPHVFCGYNYLKREDITDPSLTTGINEEADLKRNLDLILSLQEDTQRIIIITDDTTTGRQVQEYVGDLKRESFPPGLEIDLVYRINKEELINLVRDLPEKTAVLMTFFFIDKDGETYDSAEAAELIRRFSRAPLYGAWNFTFGSGIIGGYLVNGYSQGFGAGEMARQILDGIPVRAIPPVFETEHQLKFDYRELKRFSIPLSALPEGGEVFYRPSTFYSRYARIIWISLSVITLQMSLIVVLILLNRSKKRIQNQLLSQGILLKQIINHIPVKIFWKDREMRFLGCNRAYSDCTGREEEELIGKREGEIFPGEEQREEDNRNREILKTELPLINREAVRTDSIGENHWQLESRIPVKDAGGKVIGILGTEEDITERKSGLLKVERAEKKLRTIIDAIPHYIFVKNRAGDYLMTNEWTSSKVNGKDNSQFQEDDIYVLDTGRSLHDVQRMYTSAEGETFWFQITKIPCPHDLFNEPAVLGVAVDITAMKRAENELRNREEYLEITLNSIGDGVISTDEKGNIVRMNPVAEKLTGWTTEEAGGRSLAEVLPLFSFLPDKTEINPVEPVLAGEEAVFISTNLFTTGEKSDERPLSINCSPIKYEGEKRGGAVIVFRDMSEENQLRKQLSHMDKMDTLGQLAGGITHDFNNMLGGIIGASQLLKPFLTDKKAASEYLDLIISTARKAADLTKELLVFSRKREKASTSFDVEEEIGETIKLLERTIDKRITLTPDLTGLACPAVGDPSLLQNALMNLGINASHAMPEGGTIFIRTEKIHLDEKACGESLFNLKPGNYLKISFRDTGSGIPEDIIDHIFEPFFTTKEEGKGTGLGLSAVYRTVEKHGGSIEVISRKGEGAEFIILLPLIEESAPAPKEPDVVRIAEEKKHVLIVDDDMAMRITAREIVLDLGYDAQTMENGEKGVEYFRKNHKEIDLVILDMIMPGMNGRECFFAMKEIDPSVKVLLTSGFTSEEDLNILKQAGLSGFCRKPYTIAQLSRVMEEVLSGE